MCGLRSEREMGGWSGSLLIVKFSNLSSCCFVFVSNLHARLPASKARAEGGKFPLSSWLGCELRPSNGESSLVRCGRDEEAIGRGHATTFPLIHPALRS